MDHSHVNEMGNESYLKHIDLNGEAIVGNTKGSINENMDGK
jgi:hypothetical protein